MCPQFPEKSVVSPLSTESLGYDTSSLPAKHHTDCLAHCSPSSLPALCRDEMQLKPARELPISILTLGKMLVRFYLFFYCCSCVHYLFSNSNFQSKQILKLGESDLEHLAGCLLHLPKQSLWAFVSWRLQTKYKKKDVFISPNSLCVPWEDRILSQGDSPFMEENRVWSIQLCVYQCAGKCFEGSLGTTGPGSIWHPEH